MVSYKNTDDWTHPDIIRHYLGKCRRGDDFYVVAVPKYSIVIVDHSSKSLYSLFQPDDRGRRSIREAGAVKNEWDNPRLCRNTLKGDKMYFHIAVPQDWIASEISLVNDTWWTKYSLCDPIDDHCVPVTVTVRKHATYAASYTHDWAWVETTLRGSMILLDRLGYCVRERIFDAYDDYSGAGYIIQMAMLHDIDVRFFPVFEDNPYWLMCFKDEEDRVLLRLAV